MDRSSNHATDLDDDGDDPRETGVVMRRSNGDEASVQVLGRVIRITRHGFSAAETLELSTIQVVGEWNQMVGALNRLEQLLCQQGTAA